MVANNRSGTAGAGGQWLGAPLTRRTFLKTTGALAGTAAVGSLFFTENRALAANFGNPVLVETDSRVDIKYSVCLQCHSACGIRCKVVDGILVKIDGNPYHPNNLEPHLSYDTDPQQARLVAGKACAKGQAGLQVVYNPFRLKEPLKRVGPRGGGEWEPITWEQAFSEIGARLKALRDLDTPIDPNAPELGPLANKVVFSGGRNEHGQKEFTDRFWGNSFGTVNKRHDHTSICEASHHVGYELATGMNKEKGSTDLANCEFVLWFGSDPCAANFPFVAQSRKLINMLERGGKLALVDPRFNVAASKADWWLPVTPGTDAALALAIARWIIDNNRYNAAFLQRPHDNAANPTGELNVTDATLLVKIVDGHATAYLRADEAGLQDGTADDYVVWSNGAAAKYDTVDTADLLPGEVTVNGFLCKTAFELYAEQARSHTLEEWSQICGIDTATIEAVAQELTAHGRKVSVEHYRGPVKHSNGTYASWAIISLNTLVGNYNWKGGHAFGGGHWHETGGKEGQRYAPKRVRNGVSDTGIQITRVKARYEDTTEFANKPADQKYPAQRPWFPFAKFFNYQEVIPSIEDGYPYPIGALILYWNDIAYSAPAGKATVERVLKDESKIPLIVSIDIEMGETAAFADYILPDTTYLERWSTPHVGSAILTKASGVRQPVVGSFDENMNYTPVLPNTKTLEDILIGLGEAMGLPLEGEDEDGNPIPIRNAWDFHRQMISNIADEDGGVPGSSPEERLQYVLARGGRFEPYEAAYEGEMLAHRFTGRIFFFNEDLAQTHDSMTGALFDGFPKYVPPSDLLDRPIDETDAGYPLRLVTYKQAWHSMARTICHPWLVTIQPENFVEIHTSDAQARGIRTGDRVRVTSASDSEGVIGRAYVTETVRPGVVAVAHSFGHWEMSSRAYKVNGIDSDFDATRAAGVPANPVMRTDPSKSNVALQDKIGGSVSFFDTRVEVTKV
ncbi:MAG: twin-arginine translocation signal domain-containing protein [Planctomycetota bacterium]|nr:MAG: twin-arginine translocation signal domain-containing protein [Planctomycetota bacterium]